MTERTCIHELLHGGQDGKSIAVEAPGRAPLSYELLREQVSGVVGTLNGKGYSRNDRIAMVLPNGPEMATAFLSVAAGFTCAPLNPLYSQPEFEFYLTDLRVKALLTAAGEPSPAVDAAKALGIPIIELRPLHGEAGLFQLSGERCEASFAGPRDTALVLHTSGTTSRPKRVPLTQANICVSADNIAGSLRLRTDDRCLNVMPLFHIHGLIGALLSSIAAGATTVCTPGFISTEFPGWMRDLKPTWYTAVPTIHQKVLQMARGDKAPGSLRFIRSASSALPVPVMRGLEEAFGVPVIEAYGMTEASHQIAANPLPPFARKPGSVGLPRGTDVAILDAEGNIVPGTGEVAIRGPVVTAGYENSPEANASAYHAGWLRTGDTGYIDPDGYLHLLGRLKEIINRGGEKISPFEVEEALLAHSAVKEAAAFPIIGGPLGEEVGVAVVTDGSVAVDALKEFLTPRLAYFKVPARIVIVESLPKGATGKVQRIGMAARLGITLEKREAPPKAAPLTLTESSIAGVWSEVLGKDVGRLDNFLELGGDSLLATRVASRIRNSLNVEVPIVRIIDSESLAVLAGYVDKLRGLHE